MDDQLLDIAASLADGKPVDWESASATLSTADDRQVLDALRLIAAVTRPPAGDATSNRWGPLRVLERVGGGTFGDVYRAWDERLEREVALKILRHRERHDAERISTAVREGRLLARVRHSNVVTVYGAEIIEGQAGVWMEFIHGRTLEQDLTERGPFDAPAAARIGVDLASALAAIHGAGLMHRDVKTHNVIRDRDGRLVLTDLGAGCELDDPPIRAADQQVVGLAGTPVCVAPEVLAGGTATPRSDVYSLGVLLYHLVTGGYPVRGRSLKEIRDAHQEGKRTPLAAARPDLPSAFVQRIDRAIDPDPQKRYESAAAFGEALRELIAPARPAGARYAAAAAIVFLVSAIGVGAARWWRASDGPVIAVLPLKNLSADAANEYFVDGLTDEIISNLSVIDGLEVRSQTSSFAFKGRDVNLAEAAGKLNANLIVEGSVLRSNDKLRVNAQLVRARDDVPLWSGRYDRDIKDVFAIQDEISRSIVNELRLKLGRGQRRYSPSLDAYELYLKARKRLDAAGVANAAAATEAAGLFEQVLTKDASFAPAYGGLVASLATRSISSAGIPAADAFARMQPAAARAVELDPLLAEAHLATGIVHARAREWSQAEQSFHRAEDLNPNLALARTSYVITTLFPEGRLDEALKELRQAEKIDPLSLDPAALASYVEVSAGRYDDAIRHAHAALAIQPGTLHVTQVMARALFQAGHSEEAIKILQSMNSSNEGFLGYMYAKIGRRADAERLAIAHANFPSREVVLYAGLGNNDKAFEALDRMAAGGDPRVGIYLTYPELASLRSDPRFAAFRQKLRLP